jgi:DNA repair protein RadB
VNEGDPLPTGCDAVDALLGGGFERGTVTQVYGQPAAGKTNLCLGAAIEAAAAGDTAVYVDTEGVSVDRFEQVASARAAETAESVDEIAARVVIEAAHDFEEQAEAVRDVADFAERASLVVVDSLTGFYRLERVGDSREGDSLRRIADQVTHLLGLARRHDLAVVVTNQVFTDPDGDRVRALGGNTLEHWTGTVLRLDRFRGGKRRATLEKHRSKPAGETARFAITDDGVEGVEDPAA